MTHAAPGTAADSRAADAAAAAVPAAELRRLQRARSAVAALFLTNGALFANLLPHFPAIKDSLGLGNAAFGLAVASFPLGSLVAGLAAGALVRRFRSARVATAGTWLIGMAVVAAGLSPSWPVLAGALFLAGAMDAVTDVAQNSHGLRVQRLYRRSILNSFHAVWSIGAVLGGLLGTAAVALEVPRGLHLAAALLIFGALTLCCHRLLLPGPEPREPAPAPAAHPSGSSGGFRRGRAAKYGVLAALVLIAASGALVEDAGSSWGAVYLSGPLGSSAAVAGLGYVALTGMQFVGRLFGDRLVDRFGQRLVAQAGGILVCLGMGTALLFPSVPGTILGFGVAGLGVATLVPAAMHTADELPGLKAGSGLTAVSWLMRLGFLLSPPVVGAIADAADLRTGLLVVPLAGLTVLLMSPVLAGRTKGA